VCVCVFALDQYTLQKYRNIIFSRNTYFVSRACEIPVGKIENNFKKYRQLFIFDLGRKVVFCVFFVNSVN